MAACAAARRATGTRYVDGDTYVRPTSWQKAIDDGSPPCSPQIPILRSGRVLRPRSMAMRIIAPTPSRSSTWKGSAGMIFCSTYFVRKLFCASSREMPRIVCVRSFVPNEKNSAFVAISSAMLQAALDLLLALEFRAVFAGRAHHCDVHVHIGVLAEELVQRRVDEPDDHGEAVHRLVHLEEVALLERQQLRERFLPAGDVVGHD